MTVEVIRVWSRDGRERVKVSPRSRVADLQLVIERELKVPVASQQLSQNENLLLARDANQAAAMAELTDPSVPLAALGISNGSIVYLFYTGEGERVVPGPKVARSAGKMTMSELIAMQTRIERQTTAHCSGVSCDTASANAFFKYVNENLAFSVKRGGFLYGTVSDAGHVHVNFIYEPPQEGSEDRLVLMRNQEEERRVEVIAAGLGMTRVGFIFSQCITQAGKGYTLSSTEILLAAELQAESQLQSWITMVVKLNAEGDVSFEPFQLSDQCVKLFKEGCFVEDCSGLDPKHSRINKDVVVLGKDTRDVDNDFFLLTIGIAQHEGPLLSSFPVENRVTAPSFQALKSHLEVNKCKPLSQSIADFHLVLFLTSFLDLYADVPHLTHAIATQTAVPCGYQLIIESIADVETRERLLPLFV